MQKSASKKQTQIVYQQSSIGGKNVKLPTIPSNVGDDFSTAEFNSIGYYGDLLGRLDDQIKTVEGVYKHTFLKI